jgi:S-layer family protein
VANAAGLSQPAGVQQFEDVPPGHTFYDYIWRLTSLEIMSGYPCGGVGEPCGNGNLPYFRPEANATRGQAAKIVANMFLPGCTTPLAR